MSLKRLINPLIHEYFCFSQAITNLFVFEEANVPMIGSYFIYSTLSCKTNFASLLEKSKHIKINKKLLSMYIFLIISAILVHLGLN